MLESHTENALATWTVEQCAFTIEYTLRAIDDIRLSVVDAFFSLPRGGAEIGGILLGRNEGRRVTVTDYVPLDCEHATGPSFVLSPKDHTKLAEILASARGNPSGTQPVGWYHSHTRSDIHLSAADLLIHRRYFPESWQVALVLKPHTFRPTRAGFFFQETDGSIRATASYQEFELEPLAMRPLPNPAAAAEPGPLPPQRPQREPAGSVIAMASREHPEARSTVPRIDAAVLPAPVEMSPSGPELETPPDRNHVAPPAFTQAASPRSWGWLGILVALSIGLACGAVAYQTRELWLPRSMSGGQTGAPPSKPPYIGLTTLDTDGQLQIRWDRDSPAVRNADEASLVIQDSGSLPQAVQLDAPHLRAGSFTYGRQSERVDVAFTLNGPAGPTVREVATFLGKLPDRKRSPDESAVPTQGGEATQDLQGRTKKLEKTVEDLRRELRNQQKRRRLENQSPDSVK
jgi:proteasome lid subunit RPN8/RPN11